MGNNTECIAARTKMRLAGMKTSGPGRKWLSKEAHARLRGHEAFLAAGRADNSLEEKPSSYRLKPKHRK